MWKIDELWKIYGLCEIMNHAMLICNWLYDNDWVMNIG